MTAAGTVVPVGSGDGGEMGLPDAGRDSRLLVDKEWLYHERLRKGTRERAGISGAHQQWY